MTPFPSQPTILVVDDEAIIRQILDFFLRRAGFGVQLAASGSEALALYQQHPRQIDMVLLDVCMEGLDGVETLVALQQLNPAVRCCFMSGGSPKYTPEDLLRRGALHYFPKPFQHLCDITQILSRLVVDPCAGLDSVG